MKTALIGIIKNEAHDILYWLAWHVRLGVDSFILFDDDSDDGTRELVAAASQHWDIRLYHIREHGLNLRGQDHLIRQEQIYRDALAAAGEEFDWVGLLDADEYVNLPRHDNLHAFLATMGPDVGAVALHWRLHGHNGHITTPLLPPFHSFNRHSRPEKPINQHVKSFIRPECRNRDDWENVHYFPLSKGRYVMPSGRDVTWSSTMGITEDQPDWSTAFLMHFQSRSLEQFIQRTYKRRDLQRSWAEREFETWNELEDPHLRTMTGAILHQLRPVILSGAMNALEGMRQAHPPTLRPTPVSSAQSPGRFGIFALHPRETRCFRPKNGLVHDIGGAAAESGMIQPYMLQSRDAPSTAFLFALDAEGRLAEFFLLNDTRLCGLLRYQFLPVLGETSIALRQEDNLSRHGAFLSSPPDEPLVADRPKADLWECFSITAQPTAPFGKSWLSLPLFNLAEMALQAPPTLETITSLANIDRQTTVELLPLLAAHMNEQQNRELRSHLGALAPFIL